MLDGVEGARNIAVSWKNTFCSLYNRSNFARDKTNLENLVEGEGGAVWLVSTVMLRECINHLKVEKAAGADGLYAEMITVNVYQCMVLKGYVVCLICCLTWGTRPITLFQYA